MILIGIQEVKYMRSIEARFKTEQINNLNLSSYMCFAASVKKQKFTKDIINRWFNKLVSKADYSKNDKRDIVNYLYKISSSKQH